jgi:hypothetical protein
MNHKLNITVSTTISISKSKFLQELKDNHPEFSDYEKTGLAMLIQRLIEAENFDINSKKSKKVTVNTPIGTKIKYIGIAKKLNIEYYVAQSLRDGLYVVKNIEDISSKNMMLLPEIYFASYEVVS